MKNINVFLFDLDGLLADTEGVHVNAYIVVAKKPGIELARNYMHSFIGSATKKHQENDK